jgi:chromosome segregation ATPase
MTAEDERETIFERIRGHDARDVIDERQKYRWRHTTLLNDFHDLKEIHELDIPHTTERTQQLETQGYVFEVERRLHHYLSGLYTLLQQQRTLQNGVGQSFREDLQQVKSEYMRKESSRTVLGLRHYAQHENVLPLQARTSKLERSKSLVVMVDELHREDDDRDFQQHFGHIVKPYFDPTEWVIDNWPDVEQLFEDTIEVMEQQAEEEIEELEQLSEEVDELYEQVAEDYRDLQEE